MVQVEPVRAFFASSPAVTEVDWLVTSAVEVMACSVSYSTSASYSSAIRKLRSFCEAYSTEHWRPVWWQPDPVLIVLFLVWLSQFMSVSTCKVYMYAIRDFCLRLGLDDPTDNHFVEMAWRGIKRSKRAKLDTRLTLELPMLEAMASYTLSAIKNRNVSKSTRHLWITVVTVAVWGFFGLFRVGELVASGSLATCRFLVNSFVQLRSVDEMNLIMVTLDGAKQDPFRRGCEVGLAEQSNQLICPHAWMRRFESSRDTFKLPSAGNYPYFRLADNSPLNRSTFVEVVRDLLQKAGVVSGSRFNGISLRRGGAARLFSLGASDTTIMRAGRWSSSCFRLYVGARMAELVAEQKAMGGSGNL